MEFLELKSGTSVEGAEIKAFRSNFKSSTYLYIMAGTHGDEVEGVYVVDQLFNWLKELEAEIEVGIIVIPILNPDGYRAATRTNSHGVDLNRNYATDCWTSEAREEKYHPGSGPLSEAENIFLDKLFQKFPPHLIMSFHSWKPMLNYNGDCKEVAEFLERYNNYVVCDDIEGHPTPGSLGEYGPKKYNSPVLTLEFPVLSDDVTLKGVWEENEAGLKALMQSDLIK